MPILRLVFVLAVVLMHALPAAHAAQPYDADAEGTFSIVARDPNSGELGMGVQSKAFATASRITGALK